MFFFDVPDDCRDVVRMRSIYFPICLAVFDRDGFFEGFVTFRDSVQFVEVCVFLRERGFFVPVQSFDFSSGKSKFPVHPVCPVRPAT